MLAAAPGGMIGNQRYNQDVVAKLPANTSCREASPELTRKDGSTVMSQKMLLCRTAEGDYVPVESMSV
jgi:hypothetical protein